MFEIAVSFLFFFNLMSTWSPLEGLLSALFIVRGCELSLSKKLLGFESRIFSLHFNRSKNLAEVESGVFSV